PPAAHAGGLPRGQSDVAVRPGVVHTAGLAALAIIRGFAHGQFLPAASTTALAYLSRPMPTASETSSRVLVGQKTSANLPPIWRKVSPPPPSPRHHRRRSSRTSSAPPPAAGAAPPAPYRRTPLRPAVRRIGSGVALLPHGLLRSREEPVEEETGR